MEVNQYSQIEQSVELQTAHSYLYQYSLIEQSLWSEIL